jgi:2-polyprenyl-6-methoxyphenol hydroxylase-like FAD-dependent oxidoreductase
MLQNMTQVLIVGAGPTGLTLACLCRQLGIDVRVIEKNAEPSKTSKAIGLQYRVSEILAMMGIVERFIERGGSPTPVNIYHGPHKLVTFRFDLSGRACGQDAFHPRPILIPQSETERLLGDFLIERGGSIEWDSELVDFSQDERAVAVRVRRPDGKIETILSNYLISCEGAHSVIRKQAGISFEGKTYSLSFVIADTEIDWELNHEENHVWMHKDGSFAVLPLPTGRNKWRLFFELSNPQSLNSTDVTLPLIQQLIVSRTGDSSLHAKNPTWLSDFRINCRMVDRYRVGRVFLAGDAAHIHSPTGGQGITTGVQDAANLAWKLSRVLTQGAPDSLLDTYEQERLPKAKEVLDQTDRITTVFFAASGPMRIFRDFVMLPILRMKSIQKRMFGKLSQLHVNYRNSVLSHQEADRSMSSRLKAGDRAPDIAFEFCHTRARTTLFQLMQRGQPLVLIGVDPRANAESLLEILSRLDLDAYEILASKAGHENTDRTLFDVHGDLDDLYGLRNEYLCLIRPDGHLGLVQHSMNISSLKEYLKMICVPDMVDQVFNTTAFGRASIGESRS